ncbi:MAG TPA: nucleotide pyrophosphatase/phosphodiesterase family protein [Solirubrobacteraceae bacterium]|nr:nucleotide pyrophosphatase/phosphodiesterase family protein [Solirubrobacteraceae bacterium]
MPLDGTSLAAVGGSRRAGGDVRPLHEGYTFAALPATIERILLGGDGGLPRAAVVDAPAAVEHVVLVLLDAFGWVFFERHAGDHPLLRRIVAEGTVAKLTSQFPSTTAAHVTTLHTGRPVGEHGLYEWTIYDPALDALVTPLLFSFAGDGERDTLHAAGTDPRIVFPAGTVYRRLAQRGVGTIAFQPASFTPSTYDGVLLEGADLRPYATLEDAFAGLARALRAGPRPTYAYLYVDALDACGHRDGPGSTAFHAEAVRCLDAIEAGLRALPAGTVLLLAADHGQIDVDPNRTLFVNELWPGIAACLRHDRRGRPLAPAGSARDLFLHTAPGARERVMARLRELLGDRATVHATADLVAEGLFGAAPGPRLLDRVGDVCVLAAPGETVWWRERGRFDMRFRGHHGGLSAAEAETVVGSLVVG